VRALPGVDMHDRDVRDVRVAGEWRSVCVGVGVGVYLCVGVYVCMCVCVHVCMSVCGCVGVDVRVAGEWRSDELVCDPLCDPGWVTLACGPAGQAVE
jgi:hypothetical protein